MAILDDAGQGTGPDRSQVAADAAPSVRAATSPLGAALVLVATGLLLNIAVGQVVRNVLALPLYLDSIGTILAGALGGPLVGAVTGALSNVIWGFLFNDPEIVYFAITAAGIGIAAGIAASLGAFSRWYFALLAGLLTGVMAVLLSAPMSAHVLEGRTGGGGQAVIDVLAQLGGNVMAATTLQAFLSDPVDKALSFLVVYAILRLLPAELRRRIDLGGMAAAGTRTFRSSWRYGLAALLSAAGFVVTVVFWPAAGRSILAVFYLAVALSAWNGGLGPGLLAMGVGATVSILVPLADPESGGLGIGDWLNLCVFLTVSSLIALITEALDRSNRATQAALVQQRRSEAEVRSVVDSVVEALALVSPGGRLTSVNRRFEQLFGIPAAEVEGQDLADLRPLVERVFEEPDAVMDRLRSGAGDIEGPTSIMVFAQTWPQARQLALFATPVRGDGRDLGLLYGFRDVTQERELDRMKTEFVSQVSHELRTPLTAIKGFTDLILDGDAGAVSEEQAEYLGIVKSNADRLVALINDLLDVSRIESGRIQLKIERIDVAAVLASVAGLMRPLLDGKQQTLTIDVPDDVPAVSADRDRVLQVATNLVSNAHKYTQAGGSIQVSAAREGDIVRIAVRDNGMGIPEDDLPNLFSRFFRVDSSLTREIGGTGLGLSIVKSIVEMHGGSVSVDSTPGEGSTFAFTLPVVGTTEIAPDAAAAADPALPGSVAAAPDSGTDQPGESPNQTPAPTTG